MSNKLRVVVAALIAAAVLSFPVLAVHADPLQQSAPFCDVMQSTVLPPPLLDEDGASPAWRWLADGNSSYCASCSCDDEDCKENCSKCW